jgi:hypothetical protein
MDFQLVETARGAMRSHVNIGILLFSLLLTVGGGTAACAQGGGAGAPAGAPPPAASSGGTPGQLAGEWNGKYVCGQGVTGLHLIVAEKGVSSAVALIHFFPLPENPKAAEGCYTAGGSYDAASGNFNFQHQDWLIQPRRYLMADVRGKLDAAGQTITGNLVGPPNCSIFFLSRGPAPRTLPDRCLHPR